MTEKPPYPFTVAWYRNKSDEELEDKLRGGPPGNKDVEGALIELNRRAIARQEKWSKRGFWAAAIAAVAAVLGIVVAIAK